MFLVMNTNQGFFFPAQNILHCTVPGLRKLKKEYKRKWMRVLLHLVSSENTVHTHYLSEYMLSIWASESRPLLMFELQSWVYKEKGLLFHLNLHKVYKSIVKIRGFKLVRLSVRVYSLLFNVN